MARRTGRQQADQGNTSTINPTAEAPAEAPTKEDAVTTATEAPVETPNETQDETPVETPEEAPTEESKKKEEAPIDLTEFENAVAAALAEADTTTGQVPVEPLSKVTEAYRALDGLKAKNKAKNLVNDKLSDAMNSGRLEEARSYFQIGEEGLVAAAGGHKKESTPTDPTEAFTQLVASLSLAYGLAVSNPPENVASDWNDKATALTNANRDAANTYAEWFAKDADDRGDEPEVSPFVKAAVKLAKGKPARAGATRGGGGGTFSGERRDIGKHIVEAFADKEVGTFMKIAEIRNVDTTEYKAGEASAGAISARLFPDGDGSKSSMLKVGIKPDTQNGKKGAVKVTEDGSPVE